MMGVEFEAAIKKTDMDLHELRRALKVVMNSRIITLFLRETRESILDNWQGDDLAERIQKAGGESRLLEVFQAECEEFMAAESERN